MIDLSSLVKPLASAEVELPGLGVVVVRALSAYEVAEVEAAIDAAFPVSSSSGDWSIGRAHRANLVRLAVATGAKPAVEVVTGDGQGNSTRTLTPMDFAAAVARGVAPAWAEAAYKALGAHPAETLAPVRKALGDLHEKGGYAEMVAAAKKP